MPTLSPSSLLRAETPWSWQLTAVLVLSTAAILSALAFQYLGGYAPCPLCLQQRYAYYFAIPATLCALLLGGQSRMIVLTIAVLVGLAYLANAGLGVYHSGAEWKFWPGPQTCSGTIPDLRTGDLSQALKGARVIRCDEAAWRFLGLSFAGWNVVTSLVLAAIALAAGRTLARSSA